MKLTATYDPAKDAENYIHAIFDAAYLPHGRIDMKEQLIGQIENQAIKEILTSTKDREYALQSVSHLLTDQPGILDLNDKAKKLEQIWIKLGNQVIFQLESIYNNDFPFESIHVDLTTLPICPYNYKNRQIFVHAAVGIQGQLRILSHELNHFMFYYIYGDSLNDQLNKNQLELLKESLALYTNPEQAGKPHEEPLRNLYIQEHVKSLDLAVKLGTKFLQNLS